MFEKLIKLGLQETTYQNIKNLCKNPRLSTLFWETTLSCNMNCKHCGSRAGGSITTKDDLTTEEIKKVFKDIATVYDASKILIAVTGGEPLLRKDLIEVMTYATSLGFKWGMTTNGLLLTDEMIEDLKNAKMSTVSISLDGLRENHDNFRRVPGAFDKTVENIKKLQAANFLKVIQVTTVINKANYHELEDLYKFMTDLNLDSWRVVNMDPIGRANDNADLLLDKEQFNNLIDFIKEKRKISKMEVTYGCSHYLGFKNEGETRNHMFMCLTGLTVGSVLHNGDIFVCPNVKRRPELIQGNVKMDNFVEVWENRYNWFRSTERTANEKCKNCEHFKYCRGDSLHTWDFENNKPKLCYLDFSKEEDSK